MQTNAKGHNLSPLVVKTLTIPSACSHPLERTPTHSPAVAAAARPHSVAQAPLHLCIEGGLSLWPHSNPVGAPRLGQQVLADELHDEVDLVCWFVGVVCCV